MLGIQRIIGFGHGSVGVCAVAMVAATLLGCGSAQPVPPDPADPAVEVAILYACSLEFVQSLEVPLAGADAGLGSLATSWWEDGASERVRVVAQVYTHPRFGPGGEFDVQRERWDEASATWGRELATSEDRALSASFADAVRACWSERTQERVPGRHS
jgi:hypothetical protein